MEMGYHVYDHRTGEILFSSEDDLQCIHFMNEVYKKDEELAEHIWLKEITA